MTSPHVTVRIRRKGYVHTDHSERQAADDENDAAGSFGSELAEAILTTYRSPSPHVYQVEAVLVLVLLVTVSRERG